MTIRRYAELIVTPILVIGGYILLGGSSGFLADLWEDFLGPFLITFWIGLGFTNTWEVVRQELRGASPTAVAVTGVIVALFILGMLGGPRVLLDGPWLFGVAVAPGLELARPWWAKRHAAREKPGDAAG